MAGMRFWEGHSCITSKAPGRPHPQDLPKHAVLEACLQNCARKSRELHTRVDWKLGGGIEARMFWDNCQTGYQEQGTGLRRCWGSVPKGLSKGGLRVRSRNLPLVSNMLVFT